MQRRIVTVVGGSGFLGRYVVKKLAEAGYVIRVLCRHPEDAKALRSAGSVGQVVIQSADITQPDTLRDMIRGSFAVVNLVGILYQSGKQTFMATQEKGAETIAKLARESGVSAFIQVSALGVERAAKTSRYAATKLNGEQAVRAAFPEATILRPSIIFGPGDGFFHRFAVMARFLPALPIIGGGHTKFQPVYAGDVSDAVVECLTRSDAKGHTYELGGPQKYSFKEMLHYAIATAGSSCRVISLPFPLAFLVGLLTELLPKPLITTDQVRLLRYNNVVSEEALTLHNLGITPTAVESVVPEYISHYTRTL